MMQNQVVADRQKQQQSPWKAGPALTGQTLEHPFLHVQDIIGNHGLLRLAGWVAVPRRW